MCKYDYSRYLETFGHSVSKPLPKGDNLKVLVIGFKGAMKVKHRRAHISLTFTDITGKVIYKHHEEKTELQTFDEIDIPVNIIHLVKAKENSICILTQG